MPISECCRRFQSHHRALVAVIESHLNSLAGGGRSHVIGGLTFVNQYQHRHWTVHLVQEEQRISELPHVSLLHILELIGAYNSRLLSAMSERYAEDRQYLLSTILEVIRHQKLTFNGITVVKANNTNTDGYYRVGLGNWIPLTQLHPHHLVDVVYHLNSLPK